MGGSRLGPSPGFLVPSPCSWNVGDPSEHFLFGLGLGPEQGMESVSWYLIPRSGLFG